MASQKRGPGYSFATMATGTSSDYSRRHISELGDPRHRFLAQVVEYTLAEGFRTPDDFLRLFPPAKIVESLASADELRVKLLVAATGTHEKIALKKSVASATEDLELALAEHTTSAAQLLGLYSADDRVRHLDAKKLWQFIAEDEFYRATPAADAAGHSRAAGRLTFILECALGEGLLSLRDVADGITFDEIARSLPVDDLREIVRHALDISRSGAPLTEERLLSVIPLSLMISRLPLDHVWQRVLVDRVASPAGFSDGSPALAPPSPAPTPSSVIEVPVIVAPPQPPQEEVSAPAAAGETRAPDEDEVRRRVIERLRQLDRLPPSHGEISTPVLLSMESMYADLWSVSDDDEREACIRESFPNETLLRTAMLALIELLDPSVDTHDPIIRDADVSGLIKIVLFEERRRRDASPPSPQRSSQTPQGRSRRSIPPPLPRSSTPPPLPPEGSRSSPPPLPAEAAGGKRDR